VGADGNAMAKYLVTGIAGFIGSNIARRLLAEGHAVRGIDNLSTGRRDNVADIARDVDLVIADLRDAGAAAQACAGVEVVFHEAALPSVARSVADPATSNDSNITGTLNLLIAARDAGVRRVMYAASSSAYGNTLTLPKHEGMVPAPISPYAVTKLTGEHYMRSFFECYGLETVSLRYFNVFGPCQDPGSEYSGVLARFATQMLRREQPTIFGDGEQSRDFTFVDNVVDGNLLASAAPAADVAGKMFNVATARRVSLNETFAVLKGLTGYPGEVKYGPERTGDVKHSLADISLARKHLKYEPSVAFELGLERTVAWYRTKM
jgi:UDP-glucose 4-epimerase